ncbi:MAG TPA: PQQ-binding-like beta-propeller repeat protein [Tepidisphaeraceae bacterium]|nr:PQQ-binding-like beta-propeller repeat protein [Tepidisphaeraceae bacterium]
MPLQRANVVVCPRSIVAIMAAGALACAALSAQAQTRPADPQVEQPPALNPDSFYGKEPTEGVYVRDSAGAVEKLALAQKMERLKEWNKSADLYQEVIVKYADRVVPSQLDKDKHIYQYTSITNRIQEQLAHWPPVGLEVYRARFEAPAQALLDGAGPADAVTLNKVYSLYFVTDAGKQAGIRLIDLYLENGEYSAAAWLGDRLLSLQPNLLAERSAILYRTALAYQFSGDAEKAKARLQDLRGRFPNDRGTVRGKDVILADSLARELEAPVAGSQNGSPDSWPIAWGDSSRGRISAAEGRPGARLYGVSLSKPNYGSMSAEAKAQLEKGYGESIQEGQTLGIMPVADRGELFFQDGSKLYGISMESGVPLPGWLQTYPNGGAFALPNTNGSPRGHQLTVTITDHEVLGIMGQPDQQAAQIPGLQQIGEPKLICLDRQTGKEKWSIAPSQLPDLAKDVRLLQLSGSPLIVGDAVLVIARGAKTQFEDCYVVAFDLATGKHRWSTYVASASTGAFMWGVPQSQGDSVSHLAYANGRIYVQTNLGALAALDAYTGAVAWLDIYPTGLQNADRQNLNPFQQAGQNVPPRSKPWTFNPVIVQNGVVFSLPTEGHNLLVYDAGGGIELKRIALDDIKAKVEQLSDLDTLVGVVGDNLLLAGEKGMIYLNWKNYTKEAFNPERDNITQWFYVFPQEIRGRSFIVRDSVYVPCADRLYCISLKSGKDIEEYPKRPPSGVGGAWEDPEEPGNVLATSDHVIIAGARMVNVYTDLALARAKLDRELAAAPNDPQPRLRYAEVTFVAGDADSALAKLDEAISLLGGVKSISPGASRDRLFNDALTFAEKLARSGSDEDRGRAVKLFGRAAAAADSPAQQVRYRLARAKFEESKKDYVAAVGLYQEILADRRLRAVAIQGESAGAAPLLADAEAENRIAAIVKARPATYESFEQAAAAAMEQAKAATDNPSEKLLEVARTYPNSMISAKAMIAAADAYEAVSDSRRAIRVLRDLWFKYPQSADKARILESVARNYVALAGATRASAGDRGPKDDMEAAAAALARAAALAGDPKLDKALKLRDGTTIDAGTPISGALDAVRKYRVVEASRALPDLGVPVPAPNVPGVPRKSLARAFLAENKERDIVFGVKSLVLSARDFGRTDRVVTFGVDGSLSMFAAGQIKPLATTHAVNEEPASCAWVGDQLLVWGGSQIVSVKSTTGETAWKLDFREMQPIDVVSMGDAPQAMADPNAGNAIVAQRVRHANFRGGGRVNFRPPMRPQLAVLQQALPAPRAVPAVEAIVEVRPVGDHVLLTTTTGRILSAELANGHVAWQTRLGDRPVDRLVANEDFAVVRVSDEAIVRIAAFDTATGQLRSTRNWTANGMVPINLALAADGTLVYTMPDRLCLKDLYKPWPDPSDKEVQAANAQMFQKSTLPDQLLISEGRILALADDQQQSVQQQSVRYVRIHSLETGQPVPLRYRSPEGDKEIDRILVAGKSEKVTMRVVGSHLYLVSAGHVYSYNLDHPGESWGILPDSVPFTSVRDVTVAKNWLAIVEAGSDDPPTTLEAPPAAANPNAPPVPVAPEPGGAAAENETIYNIYLLSLAPISKQNPVESGLLGFDVRIADAAGIAPTWQAIDGGLCYLTADNKLHILRGSMTEK